MGVHPAPVLTGGEKLFRKQYVCRLHVLLCSYSRELRGNPSCLAGRALSPGAEHGMRLDAKSIYAALGEVHVSWQKELVRYSLPPAWMRLALKHILPCPALSYVYLTIFVPAST